jgi:hypothetical protein
MNLLRRCPKGTKNYAAIHLVGPSQMQHCSLQGWKRGAKLDDLDQVPAPYHKVNIKSFSLSKVLLQMNAANHLLHPFCPYLDHFLSVAVGTSIAYEEEKIVTSKTYTHVDIEIRLVVVGSFEVFWFPLCSFNLPAFQGRAIYTRGNIKYM